MKKKPRVEIVRPPWIDDPSKYPFARVIEDPKPTPPTRIQLNVKQLVDQIGCNSGFIKLFLANGELHAAQKLDGARLFGLCAEDLAALALSWLLIDVYNMPPRYAFGYTEKIRDELLHSVRPLRTVLFVFRANKRTEIRLSTARPENGSTEDPVCEVPGELRPHMDLYDASSLRDRIDAALNEEPLNLPKARTSRVHE